MRISVQPLRSTVVTRFLATMGCPTPAMKSSTAGLPGSVSICPHAPPTIAPESPMAAYSPLLHHWWQASSQLVKWPLSVLCNEAESVRVRCGSRVCLARLRDGDYSHSTRLRGYVDERVISTVSSFQLTRWTRLCLAHQLNIEQRTISSLRSLTANLQHASGVPKTAARRPLHR